MAIERRLFLKRIGLSLSAIPFLGFLGCKKKEEVLIHKTHSLGPTEQAVDVLTKSTLDMIIEENRKKPDKLIRRKIVYLHRKEFNQTYNT